MSLFKPNEAINYIAECEYCDSQTTSLSNNHQVAVAKLVAQYNWIVYDDYETTFCSEKCLDNYEILHVEDILNLYDD